MKTAKMARICVLAVLGGLSATAVGQESLGTAFTYQGGLEEGGSPVNGQMAMRFSLWDAEKGGMQIGPTITFDGNSANPPPVQVDDGLFTVELDFSDIFLGDLPFLQVQVRHLARPMYTTLLPRQPLTPTPNALFSQNAQGAVGIFHVQPQPEPPGPNPAIVAFGRDPDDVCSIGIDPILTGLNLRDPGGVRVLNPQPMLPTRLLFGPTDDCSIGIDPVLTGLVERDPFGFRLLGPGPGGASGRLLFGRTDDCSISVDPGGPAGLNLRDPAGIRILQPSGAPPGPTRLLFGPTDDCSIGIDPVLTGLVERDPIGFRLLGPGPGGAGGRLLFGRTDDCSISVDPGGPTGLNLRDTNGIRVLNPEPMLPTRLLFGPTDDCSIGIDPVLTGLVERDPIGFRLLGPGPGGAGGRLLFGRTDDCSISVDPGGPAGLNLRDTNGIRVLNPEPMLPTRLLFGPTDDCSIGIDPVLTGLVERDPIGFRLLGPGPSGAGGRLLFGRTDDCTIGVDPGGPAGINLRDPNGIRVLNPNPTLPTRMLFGRTDDCTIGIDPILSGLNLRDPGGVRVVNPTPAPGGPSRILFGPTDDCSIGIDPVLTGLIERDPIGLRLVSMSGGMTQPGRLIFGPTDDCSISAGTGGMQLDDPQGFFFHEGNVGIGEQPQPPGGFRLVLPTTPGPGGQALANAWINASSRRWKENIRPIDNALDLINRLEGVYFDWKSEQGGKPDVGFIAEDVGAVLPELVAWEADGEAASGLNYDHIVAVTVEGIKAQQEQIDVLKHENAVLRSELAGLKAQVAAIAARLQQNRANESEAKP